MDKPDEKKKTEPAAETRSNDDVVVIGSRTADGAGANVLRLREGRVEAGQIRSMQPGKPIVGEVVTLRPREECPNICDVKVEYAGPSAETAPIGNRPAQVATEKYRNNWDAIWSRPPTKELPS